MVLSASSGGIIKLNVRISSVPMNGSIGSPMDIDLPSVIEQFHEFDQVGSDLIKNVLKSPSLNEET